LNTSNMKRAAVASIASAILGLGLTACGGSDSNTTAGPATVRSTAYGQVDGVVETDGNTVSWRGVPFAKPPVGTLRWQPPQAPDAWTGTRSAKDFADACSQIGGLFGPPPTGKDYSAVWETFYKQIGSEDCLYLNIWSPVAATDASAKLPVIVYIHGGSNVVGAAFDPLLQGGNLAKNANAVVVTVAYRLGLFGWFANPAFNTGDPVHDSGDYALLDLVQSLKFVRDNIANFGGDPGNVTIMGQSAGSTNVNALIVTPLAAGLFHKAISLSGGIGGSSMTAAVNKSNAIINALLIKDKLATDKTSADAYRTAQSDEWIRNYLMTKTAADLYGIQVDPTGGKWGTGSRTFEPGSTTATLWGTVAPIADGTVLPTSPSNAVKAGTFNKVPQIVGNTSEEGKLFSSAFKIDDYTRVKWMNGQYLGTISGLQLGDIVDASIVSPLTVDNYNTYTYNNANHVVPAPSITTAQFWALSNASNAAYYGQVPLYAYDFKWNEEPAPWNDVYGAWHAEDLAFVFGNFGMTLEAFGFTEANKPGRLALSNAMQQSVAAFIRTGDPNNASLGGVKWDPWTPTDMHRLVFDATPDQLAISEE